MIGNVARERLGEVLIAPSVAITGALRRLDAAGTGALLVCEADGTLRGIVTDGDIRRAVLRGIEFSDPVETIAKADPLVAAPDVTPGEALRLMDEALESAVNHLPLVEGGRAVGLLLRHDLVTREQQPLSALIMAGGFGSRMLPLTERTPKPMLRVDGRPLLERTLGSLRSAGISRVAISTHYLGDSIRAHFGNGHDHGVDLHYLAESQPLGTAGALRLVNGADGPLLVVNGDILTGVSFGDLLAFHRAERAELTVGMRRCELQLPYGVLDCEGARVQAVREKPRQSFWVNAGIYLVEPSARQLIPEGARFDMTDLIDRMLEAGRTVVGFPIVEYWLDIGQPADYLRAQADAGPVTVTR